MDSLTTIKYYIYFAVYDNATHELLYTKYNFDYNKYKFDFGLTSLDKGIIFADFLVRNPLDYTKPYAVLPQYIKYFRPMTSQIIEYIQKYGYVFQNNYMENQKPPSNVSFPDICANQFNMILYSDLEYRRIQDYYYNDSGGIIYSKYNFKMDNYSNDFNVFGTKLAVFTDFVIRCINLSGIALNTRGYGIATIFIKYFDTTHNNSLISYLNSYGVTSDYSNVKKSFPNIDFVQYGIDNADLSGLTDDQLKEHYLFYGQFEQRVVQILITPNNFDELIIPFVGSIYVTNNDSMLQLGTCFLYKNPDDLNIYIVTCYHLIENVININIIHASFELKNHNSIEITSTTAVFRIIGYDIYTDVLVAIYDPTILYNMINNVDLTVYTQMPIDFQYVLSPLDTIYTLGNFEYQNNNSILQGSVIDPLYAGGSKSFVLAYPDSILIQMYSSSGVSGAPIVIKTLDGQPKCVGMMVGYISKYKQYSVAIAGFQLNEVINSIILQWNIFSVKYAFDTVKLNYYIKDGVSKRWLGVVGNYFVRGIANDISTSLINFPYTGGLIVTDFIIGFNYTDETFITNPLDLSKRDSIQINTILLNTGIYKNFVDNDRNPIVIKSLTFFNGIKSEYTTIYIGKYSNQVSYSAILYGLAPISNFAINGYFSSYANIYPNITIEYYYYDGNNWILASEIINSNIINNNIYSTTNYNIYTDSSDVSYYQHQLEFPTILIPYLTPYLNNNQHDSDMKNSDNDYAHTGTSAASLKINRKSTTSYIT